MSDEYKPNKSSKEETPESMINEIVKQTTGKDRYISSTSTAEQNAIAEARKKKIAGFKLNINEDILKGKVPADNVPSKTEPKHTVMHNNNADIPAAFPKRERLNVEKPSKGIAEDIDLSAIQALQNEVDISKQPKDIQEENITFGDTKLNIQNNVENILTESQEDGLNSVPEDISSFSGEEQRIKMSKEEKEMAKRYKKQEKRRQKEKAEKNGCLFKVVWLAMIVILAVVLGMFFIRGSNDMLAVERQQDGQKVVTINIPENASLDDVAKELVDKGVINEEMFFKAYATVTKNSDDYKSGSVEVETDLDYEALLNLLKYGRELKDTIKIQIQEGLSVREIATILEEKKICTKDDFIEMCNSDVFDDDYSFIKAITNSKDRYYKLEGYLFPDTYEFYIGESAERSVRRFLDNFQKRVIDTKKKYTGYDTEMSISEYAELMGKNLDDVINMASIVQAEAANDQDMYYISSIFYNRIRLVNTDGISPYGDMDLAKLKSDTTLFYPYVSKEEVPDDIKSTFVSKYDTYEIQGLPAGAICNPGLIAMDAALNPFDTGYYYFCHKAATDSSAAEAFYAYTFTEHEANMKKAGLTE